MLMSAGRIRRTFDEGGVGLVLRKGARQARTRLTIIPASRSLHRQVMETSDIEQAVDLAYDFSYDQLSVRPQQKRSEITALLRYLREKQPRTVVEIGTASGGTLLLLASVAAADATLVTLDLPRHFSRERLHRAFGRSRQVVHTVRGDSHAPQTKAIVRKLIGSSPVDFLFIDGDHSYDGVKADYEDYAPLVGSGGAIGFHDIVPGPAEFVGGVPAFWEELKRGRDVQEYVEDWGQGGLGIGLVEVD